MQDGIAFNPTSTASYTVTGTNANGCTDTASIVIAVNNLPNVSATASSSTVCLGESVNLQGAGATTYSWDNGVQDGVAFSTTNTASYTVTGTDANGCTDTASIVITVEIFGNLIDSIMSTDLNCFGDSSGSITVQMNQGSSSYNFNWSNNDSSAVINLLNQGQYSLTVTNQHGCTDTITVTIDAPPVLSIVNNTTDASCNVCTDGQIQTTISGGTAPYSYLWSNMDTTSILSGISGGNYNLIVRC